MWCLNEGIKITYAIDDRPRDTSIAWPALVRPATILANGAHGHRGEETNICISTALGTSLAHEEPAPTDAKIPSLSRSLETLKERPPIRRSRGILCWPVGKRSRHISLYIHTLNARIGSSDLAFTGFESKGPSTSLIVVVCSLVRISLEGITKPGI